MDKERIRALIWPNAWIKVVVDRGYELEEDDAYFADAALREAESRFPWLGQLEEEEE